MNQMYTWAMIPVVYRKDAKDENLLSLADKDDKFAERFMEIEATAEQLDQVLKENYKLFFDILPENIYDKEELELLDGSYLIVFIFICFIYLFVFFYLWKLINRTFVKLFERIYSTSLCTVHKEEEQEPETEKVAEEEEDAEVVK